MLSGKSSDEYLDEISTCELDQKDIDELNLSDSDFISIKSDYGCATVKLRKSKYSQKEIAFIPLGIVANILINPDTNATGMPSLKNIPITISKSDQEAYEKFMSNIRKEFE